jgi:hypothetical protein
MCLQGSKMEVTSREGVVLFGDAFMWIGVFGFERGIRRDLVNVG